MPGPQVAVLGLHHRPQASCLVCRKHRGLEVVAGGPRYDDNLVCVSNAQLWSGEPQHYLGHLFVEPKRHAPGLADLTEAEAQAIGLWASRGARRATWRRPEITALAARVRAHLR